jgi:hypothetical protein
MYQAPTSTLTQPAMEAIRKTSGYAQPDTTDILSTPTATLNPSVLEKAINNNQQAQQSTWWYQTNPNQIREVVNSAQKTQSTDPLKSQAKQQYGKHLGGYQKFRLKEHNAHLNEQMRTHLKTKYDLKYVPEMYESSYPYAGMIPSWSFFKKPIVTYNPKDFSSNEELEFVLLHEIGHGHHQFINNLQYWIKKGIRPSIMVSIFLNAMSLKYGLIGFFLAPKLFHICFLRFFEEPHADDFAVRYASKDPQTLKGGLKFFQTEDELNNKAWESLSTMQKISRYDYHHPSLQSRIRKIQNALDGNPNYFRITRFFVLLWVIKEVVEFAYAYSTDATSLQEGLEKIKDIENNPEAYCNKFEIPEEGRPMYKYALENVKQYFKTKLTTLEAEKEIILDEETIVEQAIKDE